MILLLGGGRVTIDLSRWAPTVNFQKAKAFPPSRGEWFQSPTPDTQTPDIVLGCLKCKGMYSVNPKCHTVLPDGRLQPSWTCVLCGSHTIVHLVGYHPESSI